jgi:flagellar biosynthesis/type III secretory pathway protein FliH
MLIEALEKEKEQIRQSGREEGREEGEATARQIIEQILQRRLGKVPAAVHEHLALCDLDQLNTLVNPALDMPTWEEFAACLPERKGK